MCEALRAAGIEVFLDQSELRGGDAWDLKIRREIHSFRHPSAPRAVGRSSFNTMNIPFIAAGLNEGRGVFRRSEWLARCPTGELVLARTPLQGNVARHFQQFGFQLLDAPFIE
jgi:hypothetical protein